jgi:hypothetical protein
MFMMPLFALFLFGPALADEVAFTQNAVEVKNRSGHPQGNRVKECVTMG